VLRSSMHVTVVDRRLPASDVLVGALSMAVITDVTSDVTRSSACERGRVPAYVSDCVV
jgi:hypothetical protein